MKGAHAPKRRVVARRASVTVCFGGLLGGWLMPASAPATAYRGFRRAP